MANGATGGYADRLLASRRPGNADFPGESFKVDGVSKLMHDACDRMDAAAKHNRRDTASEQQGSDLWKGVTTYLASSAGTGQDRALDAADGRTGLRTALTSTLDHAAPVILAGSTVDRGNDLSRSAPDRFAAYARFEMSGDQQSAQNAERTLGRLLDRLSADVVAGKTDGGAALHAEFGLTFSQGQDGLQGASRIAGTIAAAAQRGAEQSVSERDRLGQESVDGARSALGSTQTAVGLAGAVPYLQVPSMVASAGLTAASGAITAPPVDASSTVRFGDMTDAIRDRLQHANVNHSQDAFESGVLRDIESKGRREVDNPLEKSLHQIDSLSRTSQYESGRTAR